jgi:DNA polymerase-3 subunit alpha
MDKKFCHLHCHTVNSLLDGVSKWSDMIIKAKEFGMSAVARTDHGNMFNAISSYKECLDNNITFIQGYEAYVAPDSHENRDYASKAQSKLDAEEDGDLSYSAYHLTLLAKNRQGFDNLKTLSTIAYRKGFYRKPRIDLDLLTQHKDGLIVLSGCLASMTSRLIVNGQKEKAIELIDKQRGIWGEDFYLELMFHNIGQEENDLNAALIDIGKTHGIPCIMSNDSHFTEKSDVLAHEVALCIGTNKDIHNPKHFKFNGEGYWFKSPEDMYLTAGRASIPEEALTNTIDIANKIEDYGFKLTSKKHLPQVPLFRNTDGEALSNESCHSLLNMKVWNGLIERGLADKETYQKRVIEELDLIKRKNFSSYFLIISDIVDFMRNNDMPVPIGRGSSLGSLICYCLHIIGLDPIQFNIPFSRFINEGRKDLPDIDTDISQERRKEVLDYIVNKYGQDKVAQIVTFQTMASKASIDNVGRALGVPSATRRQVSHLIGETEKDDKIEELIKNNQKAKEIIDQVPDWLYVAAKLEGNSKNMGIHAAGIVICNESIVNQVPLVRDSKEGYLVTQYDMKDLQELGLLKLDMLGLKTLDLIHKTIKMIDQRHGIKIDFHKLPIDDKYTYNLIASGKYVSVFQYDSSGLRNIAKQLRPETFDHLMALNALYRPGPMLKGSGTGGKSILENYISRRHGKEEIEIWHPSLEEVFRPTFGLPIYQEQIMSVSRIIGGFNETEADEYRAAIGKKDKIKFAAVQDKLIEYGVKLGHTREFMNDITAKMAGSARYNWNSGHSLAYSYISYVTAYLETYCPLEYYTTLLNVNLDDNDQLKILLSAILQKGIKILPPHINNSQSEFHTDGKNIYMGLYSVHQIGEQAICPMVEDKIKYGDYKDFIDFCIRVGVYGGKVTKTVKENLVKAGAFNWDTSINNKVKLENIELIQKIIRKYLDKGISKELIRQQVLEKIVKDYTEFTDQEKLKLEREVLNFYISSHPIIQYMPLFNLFPQINFIIPSQIPEQQVGDRVTVMGLAESREMSTTRKGDPYLRLRIGDHMGSAEIMVWNPLAGIVYGKVSDQSVVLITGTIKEDKFRVGENQLCVYSVTPLPSAGMPIASFYCADVVTANRVLVTLNATGTISAGITHIGHIVQLNQCAYITPNMYNELRNYNINYQLSL